MLEITFLSLCGIIFVLALLVLWYFVLKEFAYYVHMIIRAKGAKLLMKAIIEGAKEEWKNLNVGTAGQQPERTENPSDISGV